MSSTAAHSPAKAPGNGKAPAGFFHKLYTSQFSIDFVGRRRTWYAISIVLIVISLLAVTIRGLNLGIEFKGGSVFTVPVAQVSDETVGQIRSAVDSSGIPDVSGAQVTTVGDGSVRVQTRSLSTEEVVQMRQVLADQEADVDSDDVTYQLIGPSWGSQITVKAIQALVVFLVLVGVMIWIFFRNWRMSLSALLALAHDLIVTVGLYALIGFTFTPATLIGLLTILGYSLYDTVVVFDKVRENTANVTKQNRTFSEAANTAINDVLVRSINTTLIGVLPVLALLIAGVVFMGGDGPLADLGLALLLGMVAGAYSSIFIATPLFSQLRERQPDMVKHRANLAKRAKRAKAKVKIATTEVDETVSPSTMVSDATPVSADEGPDRPLDSRNSAGRAQPARTTRSQRKK
ncbi:protein translocase subunit SecF [Propionibacterium australiense]|uniref:Protein-export membrane protein SecF n=1 Tax=Propionibacterium australiense TaxID=119981 RepID=A0A383S3E2_9ACTN|nr:protein translocase subunit SecF [Propionibacterium australiense]RLP11505.1 protein translocase subunit SecF [Propionibacterium australiense]RLP12759.1 protein translocase subunit SecF [Propionibacterium australiense]SYZ32211.1 Bacterial translocase SecF protein signature [Propionibacterium australiense]VEH90667.1 preprotein translocase subunit SecF [Propionibacterium australiense]